MVYFIDTENIYLDWLSLLDARKGRDKFVLFYTPGSFAYPMNIVHKLALTKASIEYVPCESGKNALDFQLIAELGKRTAKSPITEYAVVSRDKGYDSAVNYMNKQGYKVLRIEPSTYDKNAVVGDAPTYIPHLADKERQRELLVSAVSLRLPQNIVDRAVKILTDAQNVDFSSRKTHVFNTFKNEWGSEIGATYYANIKMLI